MCVCVCVCVCRHETDEERFIYFLSTFLVFQGRTYIRIEDLYAQERTNGPFLRGVQLV